MAPSDTALIIGVTGQDGAHLAQTLIAQGVRVIGGFRRGQPEKLWRLDYLGISDHVHLVEIQLNDPYTIISALREFAPDQIFHLAGDSFVADSFNHPHSTLESNLLGTLNVLEAIRIGAPKAKLFFASSSEVFGAGTKAGPLDEQSPQQAENPYAVSKLSAQALVRIYREKHGLFASSGIMFNHEGPLRSRNFVTRKITYNLARLRVVGGQPMSLGNIEAQRDWGSAAEFARAMPLILQLPIAEDFVIASGVLTSVRDFLSIAATCAGFSPEFVQVDDGIACRDSQSGRLLMKSEHRLARKFDTPALLGDSKHLQQRTGWQHLRTIQDMAREMVEADLRRWKEGKLDV